MNASDIIVCDSSPLIFLAKLNCLDLIPQTVGPRVRILSSVIEEVFQKTIDPEQHDRLKAFIDRAEVINHDRVLQQVGKLSYVDLSSLDYCLKLKKSSLLVDERLLRRIAQSEGIRVVGALGVLLKAQAQGIHSKKWVKEKVLELVNQHDLRISSSLLCSIMSQLD